MTEEKLSALRDHVARRVMGWNTIQLPWAYSEEAILWRTTDGTPLLPTQAWRPDENELQCANVLDQMISLGYSFSLNIENGITEAKFWQGRKTEIHRDSERRIAILQAANSVTTTA